MKVIGFDEIAAAGINPAQFHTWVSQALREKDSILLPAKISMKLPEHNFCNVMPCVIPVDGVMGVKVVTRFPDPAEKKPSLMGKILLYSAETGELLSLMDATYITAMRTGAVAVHSVDVLAKPDFYEIGVLGLGMTARATFKILLDVHPDRPLKIKLLRYKNQAEQFAALFQTHKNAVFEICDSVEAVMKNSDVVISCVTYTEDDFAPPETYKPGCTIIPVHTRGFMACDLVFDKIFADDKSHVEGFKYFNQYKKFAEVADVVSGRAPGRENDSERILVYNIGLALHDIYIASRLYALMKDIPETTMSEPTSKYWI